MIRWIGKLSSDSRSHLLVAAACQATTNMATDDGFTGELLLRTERKR